jgi:4-amino-4-deoxy-L-arabinose transferase-like glycosyltransferase
MKKFTNLSINNLIPENARPFPKILFLILILSFALNIIGINWGLPSPSSRGWAADEITPVAVMNGMEMKFSNGWSARYPPLHFYVLSLFYLPVYFLNALKILTVPGLPMNTIFFIIGRLISVFMGTFIVFMVYLCGCEIIDKKSALFASIITALTPPFLYYSKTSNVDIPYIFWFMIALYFFIRILKYHRTYDYIFFSITAVFSICTKDQAYGLLILIPFIIIYSYHRHNRAHGKPNNWVKSLFNKKTISALILGTSLFALIHNFIFNFQGFKKHLLLIIGPAKGERIFSGSILGFINMSIHTIKQLNFILGWPILIICILGFIYALTRKKKYSVTFWLLAPGISYYLSFIFTIGKDTLRHLMPIYILMSFFGALGLSSFLFSSKKLKIIKYALVILLFVNSAVYSLSVDVMMVSDSRYYVEHWMQENVKKDESILFAGYINFLPRNKGFINAQYILHPSLDMIQEIDPSYILINSNLLSSSQPYLYEKLVNENSGYKQILRYKSSPWLNLLPEHKINEENKIITNLNLINPEIMILKKE